jgi:hypothetical protein
MKAIVERIMMTWTVAARRAARMSQAAKAGVVNTLRALFGGGGGPTGGHLAVFGLASRLRLQPIPIRRSRPFGR